MDTEVEASKDKLKKKHETLRTSVVSYERQKGALPPGAKETDAGHANHSLRIALLGNQQVLRTCGKMTGCKARTPAIASDCCAVFMYFRNAAIASFPYILAATVEECVLRTFQLRFLLGSLRRRPVKAL
jgi:hypothetical protein